MYGHMNGDYNMRKTDQFQAVFARHKSLRDRLENILGTGGIAKYKDTWIKYMDPLRARACHNMELPCLKGQCLSVRDAYELNQGVNEETAMLRGALPDAHEYNRLSLGYFMSELRDRLMDAVNGFSTMSGGDTGSAAMLPPKFELFSGHDDTVYGLIGLLLAKDLRWPPYASNLIFELWQEPKPNTKPRDPSNYVVRIIYNGRPLAADWCDFKACPLPKYLEHIEKHIERDLPNACKAK
ncbi:histidine phosphatase superfamily [Syncephalis fuscata]|nr:histidine phosphatase superfamily [Syncephalis fuscata]